MPRRKELKKPSEVLEIYSEKLIEGLVERLSPSAFELNYSFRSPNVAHISGSVIFRNGYLLEFDEIVQQVRNKAERLKYRYHTMDRERNLVLRYDNVPNHPNIKSHPHHKHLPNKVIDSTRSIKLLDAVENAFKPDFSFVGVAAPRKERFRRMQERARLGDPASWRSLYN